MEQKKSNKAGWFMLLGLIVVAVLLLINQSSTTYNRKYFTGKETVYHNCEYCSTTTKQEINDYSAEKENETKDKIVYDQIHVKCMEPYAEKWVKSLKEAMASKDYSQAVSCCDEIYRISPAVYKKHNIGSIKATANDKVFESHAAESKEERADYAKKLRIHFLDNNMDIKISVSGKYNENLTMQYILFNDVWVHKFQQGEMYDEIKNTGFRKLSFTNGYDYSVYFDWK